jgi:hypothetical protein
MARPMLEAPAVRINVILSLRPGEDDDLIRWFQSIPARERAQAVIARLRTGTNGDLVADEAADVSAEAFESAFDGLLFGD